MASNSTVPALPNPFTPLAFLPPVLADQFQVSCFVVVAGLSAYVWDCIMSLPEEYKVLRKGRFAMPSIAYFLSRIGTLGFTVSSTVFQVAPVAHCQALLYIIGVSFMLAMSATSMLFLCRVRAVYGNSLLITVIFGTLWMATAGLSVLAVISLFGGHIGPTNRCILTITRGFASVPVVLNAIFDTLVFLAISYRIVSYTIIGDSWKDRVRVFFGASGLPRLSKGLLQGGQLYYFATIGLSIVFAAMLLAPGIPSVYHAMLSVPNIGLENAMACRVFRAVKLGFIKDPDSTLFGSAHQSYSAAREQSGLELAFKRPTVASSNLEVSVNISKATTTDPRDDIKSKKWGPLIEEGSDAGDRV